MNGILIFTLICIPIGHFPEVNLCGNVTNKSVIDLFKDLFLRYGLVKDIVSDNGAQFVFNEFEFS